jgi:hypothetical protein
VSGKPALSMAFLTACVALLAGCAEQPAPVVQTAAASAAPFVYGGANYCWYPDAWQGAGFYQCGYAWQVGLGYGGPWGWNGWGGGFPTGWHGYGVWRGGLYHGYGWRHGYGWNRSYGWRGGGGWHGGGWHGGGLYVRFHGGMRR